MGARGIHDPASLNLDAGFQDRSGHLIALAPDADHVVLDALRTLAECLAAEALHQASVVELALASPGPPQEASAMSSTSRCGTASSTSSGNQSTMSTPQNF